MCQVDKRTRFPNCIMASECVLCSSRAFENESTTWQAWVADSSIFSADVCVKLAKIVVDRIPKSKIQRNFAGVVLHVGLRGYLLSVPCLVDREEIPRYKESLQKKLQVLHQRGVKLNLPNQG